LSRKHSATERRIYPVEGPDEQQPDEMLMDRFCEGDVRAFDVLFARYARPVHEFLSRFAGRGAADDLTQTTFLSMVRARGRFRRGDAVKPWLFAIAANAGRDHLRRRGRDDRARGAERDARSAPAAVPDPSAELDVRAALARLPDPERAVIVLHRFHDLTFEEIAAALGKSAVAVRVRAFRAYRRLRAWLGGDRP
jgi:RNA polymerase sigma-70 factor (ECF subfamily)